jgi:hypothetical protein
VDGQGTIGIERLYMLSVLFVFCFFLLLTFKNLSEWIEMVG